MAGSRRPRGTGRISEKHGSWYGQWAGLAKARPGAPTGQPPGSHARDGGGATARSDIGDGKGAAASR
jgi:hypothetical protein